jgi:thiol-disulfide isomerase/thioredoxin
MKTLFFILGLMIGCAKDEDLPDESGGQETETDEQMGEYQPPILNPIGVIGADDCQHIDMGDKACDFRLTDQTGTTWDLYSHTGDVIVLDFSTVWCPPCQIAGHYMQALQDDYESEGVQIVTILIDGIEGTIPPTTEEIEEWVDVHSITTAPVLQGSRDKMFDPTGIEGYVIGAFPTYLYLGRDMTFYAGHVGFSDEYVRERIEEGL